MGDRERKVSHKNIRTKQYGQRDTDKTITVIAKPSGARLWQSQKNVARSPAPSGTGQSEASDLSSF